jgi:FMN phosphatase YigB (HAD superfamily)
MDTRQERRRARPWHLSSLDDLYTVLATAPEQPRLLSLDVFDTVLTRSCGRPSDMFLWLGRRLAAQGRIACSPEVFAQVRGSAEQAVWRRDGGLDSTAGLPEFYLEVAHRLHLDAASVPDLVAAELALETEVLRAVPAARRLLQHCAARGLPVVFTSDTYLPAEFVESRLRALDLLPPQARCLVSSAHARSKVSGRLFQSLLSDGHAPQRLLHVGDHPYSDVAAPRAAGMAARWCTAGRLNRYEEKLTQAPAGSAGFASALAGASRMARLATHAETRREAAIRDVAAGVAAPVLVAYVMWILKRAQALSLQRLVFLARDGQVLCDIAQRMVAALGLSIEIRYLYVSRRSTNFAATFDLSEEEVGWVFRDVPQMSASDFLARFDLDWRDVAGLLGAPDREAPPAAASEIADAFRAQLAEGPIRTLVLDRAAARRRIVVDYLRQEGVLDAVPQAIVDFGGVGSQVRSVHALVAHAGGRPPHIFMIGLDRPEDAGLASPPTEPAWVKDTDCYLYDHRRRRGIRRPRGFGTCVQMFCAADHGTVTGYRYENGAVVPELEMRIDQRVVAWGLPLYRATLQAFVDHLATNGELVNPYADIRDVGLDLVTTFWTQPVRDEAAAWGGFPFEGAQASGGEPRALVRRYTVRSIGQEIAARKFPDLGWQHWYEGSLAISAPVLRALLKKVETLYRSAERRPSLLHQGLTAGIRKVSGR